MMWRGIVPALLVLVSLASGQPPASHPPFDAFEVATIKPTPPDGPTASRYIRMQSAHRFQVKNYTVNGLVAAAYDVNPPAISGGPKWGDADRYDIIAETPGDLRPTYDDQMTMLRKLLVDRFNLAVHHEKKEFAIYELSVAKGGPKLRTSAAPPDESPNLTSTLFPAASGGINHILLPGRNVTMTQFASILQRAILDRPVVDHTGLTGRYEFDLEWTPDGSEFGGNLPQGAPDNGKPGLYASMQQQLGLKIEPTRGLVEALVIDRLDKPSDN